MDTAPDIHAALNHCLDRAGLAPVDEDLTRHWIGHGVRVMVEQALINDGSGRGDMDAMQADFLDYYQAHIADHSAPYPHVVECLRTLRGRGARLAVVTNKRTNLSLLLLNALDLSGHFDTIVCGDTAARPKPAPDPALHACSALGIEPGNALFVGDSAADVGCARAAGCPVVCVPDGYNHGIPAADLGADAVIDSFRALI